MEWILLYIVVSMLSLEGLGLFLQNESMHKELVKQFRKERNVKFLTTMLFMYVLVVMFMPFSMFVLLGM